MTWNEYHRRVWRASGMSEADIASASEVVVNSTPQGWCDQKVPMKPGVTEEQVIAAGAREFKAFCKLPVIVKLAVSDSIKAAMRDDNQKN